MMLLEAANRIGWGDEETPTHGAELITNSLGKSAGDLVGRSPRLLKALEQFLKNGGTVTYGPKKGGSCYKSSYVVKENEIIAVESIVIDGSLKENPLAVIQALSHEIGHATFPFKFDLSSTEAFLKSLAKSEGAATVNDPRTAYLKNRMKDEGAAVAKNIEIRHEFLARLRVDIGLTGNPANHRFYKDVYNKSGNTPAAWEAIGSRVADTEFSHIQHPTDKKRPNQKHQSYYDLWDKEFQNLMELLGKIDKRNRTSQAPSGGCIDRREASLILVKEPDNVYQNIR